MSELNDKIRQALQEEDAELFEDFGEEPSVFEMVMGTFRGRHRWLFFLGICWCTGFIVVFTFAGVKFFNAQETRDLIMWAAVCIICWSAVSAIKIWYWLEINKNSVTREVKRVELQIARLAARIKQ